LSGENTIILKCQFQFDLRSPEAHGTTVTLFGQSTDILGHHLPDRLFKSGITEKNKQEMGMFVSECFNK